MEKIEYRYRIWYRYRPKFMVSDQPRTQAQITKNRHTTVLLYRSVAKLSERAGVLGEDQGAIKHRRGNALINDRATCDAH